MNTQIQEAAKKWFTSLVEDTKRFYKTVFYNTKDVGTLDQFIVSIWIQEVVMNWWNGFSNAGKSIMVTNRSNIFGNKNREQLTNDEIAIIYLSIVQNKEVSNVSEMGVCEFCGTEQSLSNISCHYKVCNQKVVPKEEPVSVSVEEAAKFMWVGKELIFNTDVFGKNIPTITDAANWQKEQDKAIIGELLEVLQNGRLYIVKYGKPKLEDKEAHEYLQSLLSAITKATNYINQ